jgi:CheY-like chemotaxis protein
MATKGRIFIVEDHQTTARALKMYLETQGYDVAVANGVASALEHAKKSTFDLLVCDIGLPDGTGWDLMKKLSAKGPISGIAFTASGSAEDIARSRKVGFKQHLVKGSAAEDLVKAIEQALNSKTKPTASPKRATKR